MPVDALRGGWSVAHTAALVATAVNVKTTKGALGGISVYNPNGSASYLQLFDALAANVTPGTTTPTISIGIGANAGVHLDFGQSPIAFNTALSMIGATAVGGGTGPGTGLAVNVKYM